MRMLFLVLAVAGLTACNTVKGAGEDIKKGGEAIKEGAETVQDAL